MHGTRGSALNWPCCLYHPYSGIVTLIKKYDFFSEILLSKSGENWKFYIKPACLNLSNMHWKCIFKAIMVAYVHIEGIRIGLKELIPGFGIKAKGACEHIVAMTVIM